MGGVGNEQSDVWVSSKFDEQKKTETIHRNDLFLETNWWVTLINTHPYNQFSFGLFVASGVPVHFSGYDAHSKATHLIRSFKVGAN